MDYLLLELIVVFMVEEGKCWIDYRVKLMGEFCNLKNEQFPIIKYRQAYLYI